MTRAGGQEQGGQGTDGWATRCLIISAVRRLARKRRNAWDGDPLPSSLSCKVHVASVNNFPTAAGLASSAAGYACLGGCPQRHAGVLGCGHRSRFTLFPGQGAHCRAWLNGHPTPQASLASLELFSLFPEHI